MTLVSYTHVVTARDAAPMALWPVILALAVLLFVPDGGGRA
jgi:hypothetical protein